MQRLSHTQQADNFKLTSPLKAQMTHGFPRQAWSLLVSASSTFLPSVPSLLWFPSLGHSIGREADEEVLASHPDLSSIQVTRSAPRSEYSVSSILSKLRKCSILKMSITDLEVSILKMESGLDDFQNFVFIYYCTYVMCGCVGVPVS